MCRDKRVADLDERGETEGLEALEAAVVVVWQAAGVLEISRRMTSRVVDWRRLEHVGSSSKLFLGIGVDHAVICQQTPHFSRWR